MINYEKWLGFSHQERNGFLVLIILMVLFITAPFFIESTFEHKRIDSNEQERLNLLLSTIEIDSSSQKVTPTQRKEYIDKEVNKTGFKRVFNSNKTRNKSSLKKKSSFKKVYPIINVNADSASLINVKGIGPYWAGRITKFRNVLGGFHHVNQLYEMYGVDSQMLDSIVPYLNFTDTALRKVKINSFDQKELAKHPYIDYRKANVIVAYRKQHGKYVHLDSLLRIKIIDQNWLDKVSPYLTLDDE